MNISPLINSKLGAFFRLMFQFIVMTSYLGVISFVSPASWVRRLHSSVLASSFGWKVLSKLADLLDFLIGRWCKISPINTLVASHSE